MRWTLTGARLVDAEGEKLGDITVEDGAIAAVREAAPRPAGAPASGEALPEPVEGPPPDPGRGDADLAIPADGVLVLPGFVDVHSHGGGGFNHQTTEVAELLGYARWAPATGTTSFLIGVVGAPGELPEAELRAAATACHASAASHEPAAEAVGIHLEGPYINVKRRGAHATSWLRLPDPAETERLLELAGGFLRIITMAPELPGAEAMARRLAAAGVRPSIGHTDATYEQTREAIPWGFVHATHCFNAMPPLLHRAPGPLGAIVEAPQVLGELIGDGYHVEPPAMRVMLAALGPERTVIVTDSLAGTGLHEGTFTFGGQVLHAEGGVARLPDGTISGSVLTLDQALRNLVKWFDLPLPHAVRMLSTNPALAAGVPDRKGRLLPGYDADLLIYDQDLQLRATICRGRVAYAVPGWQDRFAALIDRRIR